MHGAELDWGEACHDVPVQPDLGPWDPMTPAEVSEALSGFHSPWWIAGGWAIDLHLGRKTREHADIDVLILREDQLALQHELAEWDLHAADPPGSLRRWRPGEVLPTEVHDIWCRRTSRSPWCMQIMIDDARSGVWTYRRDARIHRPMAELDGPASDADRRVLAPEVQLLQKSTYPRPKDEADLLAVRPHLSVAQRKWLESALSMVSPEHPWLDCL